MTISRFLRRIAASMVCFGAVTMFLPPCQAFDPTGSLAAARHHHTATLLPNGKVLVVGGDVDANNDTSPLPSAEIFDPTTGSWFATGNLMTARGRHTATLLRNGKVLVTGGNGLSSAELYDPIAGTWALTGSMSSPRKFHTATLLANGKVLVTGGSVTGGAGLATAELYDPDTGKWTPTASMSTSREAHTATLLPNGKVLVAGGSTNIGGNTLMSAEVYDPSLGQWGGTGSLGTARDRHTATLLPTGKVLIAAGFNNPKGFLASAETYDPANGSWMATGDLSSKRFDQTATLLPNGRVLITGGNSSNIVSASVESYDPNTGAWSATGNLITARMWHTATLLPSGKILVTGGFGDSVALPSAETYDPGNGNWTSSGRLSTDRVNHTATLLPNGNVLVAGGAGGAFDSLATSEIYDAAMGSWVATGSLIRGRQYHTATLLPNGRVLVAGGVYGNLPTTPERSAEIYDPASGAWAATGSLVTGRQRHTATLLRNGKVLVAGGSVSNGDGKNTAELYDPVTGQWAATGDPNNLAVSTATLLPSGEVFVTLGSNDQVRSELYNPLTGKWKPAASLTPGRHGYSATLLPNGKVLIAGGQDANFDVLTSASLYDPATGNWAATGNLAGPRQRHAAVLLSNGKVLAAGGTNATMPEINTSELYDPATGRWTEARSFFGRLDFLMTLLLDGRVLASGGLSCCSTRTAEVYAVGLGFQSEWQPRVETSPSTLEAGRRLTLIGSRFQGVSQASGGTAQDSSTNYPLVQLRSIDSGHLIFLPADAAGVWSDTTFTSVPISGFPFGPALATVFTNGIPSISTYLTVAPPTELANLSSRLRVETGDNVLFAGFILSGVESKKIIIRAIGSSLPYADKLADPVLELHDSSGAILETNDNWIESSNKQAIIDSTVAPTSPLESAIVRTVAPGAYTAFMRGVNGVTGIGVIELYDLDAAATSKFANIATRGLVQTGDNVLFAGMIVTGHSTQKIILRAVGPSLAVGGKLADPTLELRDSNGALLEANDNWVESPNKQAILDSTIPPTNDLEPAIVRTLSPAAYTAIVRGVGGTTGIAVIEVYAFN